MSKGPFRDRCALCTVREYHREDRCPCCGETAQFQPGVMCLRWTCAHCGAGGEIPAARLCFWDRGIYPRRAYAELAQCEWAYDPAAMKIE